VEGLQRPDLFIAVHDTFFTDTTDYADIVLPADSCLERTDFHGAYGNYYLSLSHPAIAKLGESVDNQETFRRLAGAMGYTDACFSDTDETMIRELIDANSNPLYEGLDFDTLASKGWARACVDSPRRAGINSGSWPTPSGKIEIYSEALAAEGLDPLPGHVDEQEGCRATERRKRYPLQVISAAAHHFIGNSFQSVAHLREMTSRPTFELSPEDAGQRGIRSGDRCRLFNDRGESFGYAELIDGLLPGTVGAQKQLGGINNLCAARLSDMGAAPVYYSTLAEIERAAPDGASPA
jgi:anaerobic selenocysteine-containing dehydrogenase